MLLGFDNNTLKELNEKTTISISKNPHLFEITSFPKRKFYSGKKIKASILFNEMKITCD